MSSELLVLTDEPDSEAVLPALALLPHRVRAVPPDPGAVLSGGAHDVVLVDARSDLAGSRDMCRMLSAGDVPVVALVNEGGLVTVNAEWGVDEILLPTTGPAELDARLRLLVSRRGSIGSSGDGSLSVGDLVIEEATYTARLKGRALELTYKEFELLKFLAQHAGRVFTRAQLLQEVWGYDFFGGTRTVDVHVRRLRAKLGPEHDSMIGTVRNVGYKFVRPNRGAASAALREQESAEAERGAPEPEPTPHPGTRVPGLLAR
ncbi:response regulator transcription factor [Saccharopolyspora sp. HNM0983]|uniref:Response regulator transcription factor n=1 Tax=Saccharopolyspora montiporae TaxID=2781240 RepID=A0A929B9K7_9PSEU|nr:response regulator transcription factor [Saccharopolyspora sp. HNM0983]MBE9374791.1 response regulator transcription factor [Saccharopolyspora sp. HNM0983]